VDKLIGWKCGDCPSNTEKRIVEFEDEEGDYDPHKDEG